MKFYFEHAAPENAAWAMYFLSGRKPKQIVPSKKLREWAMAEADISEWLYEESRDTVGDSSETIALLLPNNTEVDETPLHDFGRRKTFAASQSRRGISKKRSVKGMARNGLHAAADLQQTDFGQFSRRRVAKTRDACARAAFGNSRRHYRAALDGTLGTDGGIFQTIDESADRRRRNADCASVSVSSGASD